MKLQRILFAFLVLFVAAPAAAQTKQIKKIDKYIEESRQAWNIPGMAVAIVKDGEVVLSKGYGVRNIDNELPVDDKTLFAIASNTKAYTSAALAILVDEGKITWDDKVRDHLPYFELYDPYVSNNMTIRDLLCHRSGLETFSGDLIWYGSDYSREEIIRRAKHLVPAYGFREHFGYQNIMFLTAGEIVSTVSGMSWDEFIKTRFFEPLGMSTSNTSIGEFNRDSNVASPHNDINGVNHAIQWVNWDNIGPAGSINSCVSECAQWIKLQLGEGTLDSTEFWSPVRTREMWTVHTANSISGWSAKNYPTKTFAGYGLGWDLFNYHGKKIVNHGGGYDGMISKTVLVPEENLGFIIVTNNINWMSTALMYRILDEMIGGGAERDWAGDFLGFKQDQDAQTKTSDAAAEEARTKNTTPSLALEEYTGTYGGEIYGNCIVRLIGDQLAFQFEHTSLFRGTFRHWHFDTFQLNWGTEMMLPSGSVQFVLNPDGKVAEMKIVVPNPDFDFAELEFKKLD
ncbi:MAG: CubicO group peptidase (beta-lactamase class C family) [Litorivivens sp.]|jgi:CubicO group peptidase (beta-lactamase class C family)